MKSITHKVTLLVCLTMFLCFSCKTPPPPPPPPEDLVPINSNIHVIPYDSIEFCDNLKIQNWNYIKNIHQGLSGHRENFNGGFVGASSLVKQYLGFFNINNWFPLWTQKVACCGEFHHFKTHNTGDENDWNLFILPDQHSQYIIDFATPYRGASHFNSGKGADWSKCIIEGDCIEAEITGIQNPIINSILPRILSKDAPFVPSIVGDTICLYGTAVREYVHNNRPEIHPSEIIWWRTNPDVHHVLVVQDASKRFGSKNRYKKFKKEPSIWQPWARAPITTNLQIPFVLDAKLTDTIEFHLYEEASENVMKSAHSPYDQPNDPTTILRIGRNDRVIVHEHQNNDLDIGVSFIDICRQPGDTILGILNLSINIGAGTDKNQGVFYLRIEKNIAPPAAIPILAVSRSATRKLPVDSSFNLEVKSIIPKTINGELILTADLAVKYPNQKPTSTAPILFSLDADNQPSKRFQLKGKQLSNIILPSLKSGRINALFADSIIEIIPTIPTYHLLPLEESLEKERVTASEQAVTTFRKYVGGKNVGNDFIKQNKTIKLSTFPYYCISEEGVCDLEESSEVLDSLNLWANDPQNSQNYVNQWKVTAVDIFTNDSINVYFGESPPTNALIWVEILSEKFIRSTIRIHFLGRPNAVYRVTAEATMYDRFSNDGEQTYTFLSHEIVNPPISLDNADLLQNMVEGLGITTYEEEYQSRWENRINGIPPSLFLPGTIIPDKKEMAYQATLNYYIQILDDGTITEQELAGLERSIQFANQFE